MALKTDKPFDQEVERRDPWFSALPIARYIVRHPWYLPNLLRRDVPSR
jgi:hypothetical protein